jgi:N-acetylmuramoyl-L-alanine amidase
VRPRARAALVAITALAMRFAFAAPVHAAPALPSEPVEVVNGTTTLEATALARLLGATRFWRPDVRKLLLRAGSHRIVLTADNPFVVVDGRTLRLDQPVRAEGAVLHVPVALADSLPRDSTLARLVFDPRGRRVVVVPAGGVIGSPRLQQTETLAKVMFPCDRPGEARVVGRSRGHFRLHLAGLLVGSVPDSVPPPALVRTVREIPAASGTGFELAVSPDAAGWRLVVVNDRVTLEIAKSAGPDFESFAPEGPPGPRALHVVVLDPGHGGPDSGSVAGGLVEKRMALALAQALKPELERRLGARVYLTREADVAMNEDQRAEAANRVHAEFVLALHFDAVPGTRAQGDTAWCAPATTGETSPAGPGTQTPIEILPWRDVATRHAVRSREIAESLLASLELHGDGPARLYERLPVPLLGVNAPGLMLECGTLTSAADRARLDSDDGVRDLATAIAEGLEHWQRGE